MTQCQNVPSLGHFDTGTFWHWDVLTLGRFDLDVLTLECFDLGHFDFGMFWLRTFWQWDVLTGNPHNTGTVEHTMYTMRDRENRDHFLVVSQCPNPTSNNASMCESCLSLWKPLTSNYGKKRVKNWTRCHKWVHFNLSL